MAEAKKGYPGRVSMKSVLAQIKKDSGKEPITAESLRRLARTTPLSLAENYVFAGGYPRGRMIELYGPESSGKTLEAVFACIAVQQADDT